MSSIQRSRSEEDEDLSAAILALLERQRRTKLQNNEVRRKQRIAGAATSAHSGTLGISVANVQSLPTSARINRPKSRSEAQRGSSSRNDDAAMDAVLANLNLSDDDESDGVSTEGKRLVHSPSSAHRLDDGLTNQGRLRVKTPQVPTLELMVSPQRGKLRPKSASSRKKMDPSSAVDVDGSLDADVNKVLRKKLTKHRQWDKKDDLSLNLGPVWDLSALSGAAGMMPLLGEDDYSSAGPPGSARRARSDAALARKAMNASSSGQMQPAELSARPSSRSHTARLPPSSGSNSARARVSDEDTVEGKKLTPLEIHQRTINYKPNLEGEKHEWLREGQRRAARQQQELLRQIMEEADLMHAKIIASVEEANFFARQLGLPHRFSMVIKGDADSSVASASGYRGSGGDRLDRILVQMSSGDKSGPDGAPVASTLTPDKFYKEHAELHEMIRRHRSLMPSSAQAEEIGEETVSRKSALESADRIRDKGDALRIGVGLHDRSIRPRSPPKKPPKPHGAVNSTEPPCPASDDAQPSLSRKDREAFLQRILEGIRAETAILSDQCDRVVEMGWNHRVT